MNFHLIKYYRTFWASILYDSIAIIPTTTPRTAPSNALVSCQLDDNIAIIGS